MKQLCMHHSNEGTAIMADIDLFRVQSGIAIPSPLAGSHGHNARGRRSPTYNSWVGMWNRCTNQQQKSWKDYGGRGIKVCERWKSFTAFLADMGERPHGLTLERKDNDRDYEPSNCKWATRLEQRHNRRALTKGKSDVEH